MDGERARVWAEGTACAKAWRHELLEVQSGSGVRCTRSLQSWWQSRGSPEPFSSQSAQHHLGTSEGTLPDLFCRGHGALWITPSPENLYVFQVVSCYPQACCRPSPCICGWWIHKKISILISGQKNTELGRWVCCPPSSPKIKVTVI